MLECNMVRVFIGHSNTSNSGTAIANFFLHSAAISVIFVFTSILSIQQATAGNLDELNEASLDTKRKSELLHLLKQDCGSCHGLRLNGGLGPPLKAENLQSKTVDALTAIILHGNAKAAMPAWTNILKESEARWIALQLKQGVQFEN